MLHNCFTGPERSASVIADTKDHDISANFGVLARVEIDKNAPFVGYFNRGDSLPASVGVLKTFL